MTRAQHEPVETRRRRTAVHGCVAQDRRLQLFGAVLLLEPELQRALHAVDCVGLEPGIDLETFMLRFRIYQLDGRGTYGAGEGAPKVDPAREAVELAVRPYGAAEEMLWIENDRKRRDRAQALDDLAPIRWAVDDIRVHLVIEIGQIADSRGSDGRRETFGVTRLTDDIAQEEVGVCIDVRRLHPFHVGDRSQRRGRFDRNDDRVLVTEAVGRARRCAVERVADPGAHRPRLDEDSERRVVKPALMVETRIAHAFGGEKLGCGHREQEYSSSAALHVTSKSLPAANRGRQLR